MAHENLSPSRFQIGDLILDTGAHTLIRNGDEIPLTRLSFALLTTLARHAPKLMTQDELLTEVWGEVVVSDEALKQRIKKLRQAIGDPSDTPRYVASVRGLGYRLIAPVNVLSDEGPLDAGGTNGTVLSFSRMTFVNELQRRHIFPAAAIYVVVAWGVTEILRSVFEQLPLPMWATPLTAVILIAGFPVTMILAWHYDVTPDAIRPTPQGSVKGQLIFLQSIVLLTVATVGLSYLIYPQTVTRTAEESRVAIPDFPKNSIAVLPFVNVSDDASNEYLADGISEELMNLLTNVPELRVISRTSAFSYKGKGIDLPTIAEQLNVGHVLEGSVRQAGNQVRITAQLIEARSDTHLWSETYERTLDDIFATQDEIAAAVVDALKIKLLGKARKDTETNPEAYALYLQARYLNGRSNARANQQAEALLQQTLAIDPDYAPAWVELGSVYWKQSDLSVPSINRVKFAREAINNALVIDPEYAPAHDQLSRIVLGNDNDVNAAAGHLQRALQLEPRNTDIVGSAAGLMRILGRLDEANALAEFVATHDPVNPTSHSALGWVHYAAGRWDEAIASFGTALKLSPSHIYALYTAGLALLFKGEPQAALETMRSEDCLLCMAGLPIVYHALGRTRESDATLAELIAQYEQVAAYNIAYVFAYRDEPDRAFEWLDKAVQYKDGGLALITNEYLFLNLHDDPRWLQFLERIGRSPEQLAAIQFEFTLPN